MAALLRVDGVSKSFRGLLALNNVSFEVSEREIAALIGPNGAGKTTLFNVIAGVFRPDDGSVHLAAPTSPAGGPTKSAMPGSAAPSRSSSLSPR